MKKLALVPLLFVIACLCSGLYGSLHNQVSYSVAPEYFTQFKFDQFGISPHLRDRIGAAIVGWNAAWWMGAVIGIVLIPVGLLMGGGAKEYFWGMLRVFAAVVATTFLVGLTALSVSYLTLDADAVGELVVRQNEIEDDLAFARAGTMHNFSYLGGVLGILVGLVLIFRQRRVIRESSVGSEFDTGESGATAS